MGASWVALGRLLEALGRLLGTFWAPLGASWVPSGASWGPLGIIKASNSSPRPPRRPPRGPQEAPKRLPRGPQDAPRAPKRRPRCIPWRLVFFVLDRGGLPISYPRFWKSISLGITLPALILEHYGVSANFRAVRCQRKP